MLLICVAEESACCFSLSLLSTFKSSENHKSLVINISINLSSALSRMTYWALAAKFAFNYFKILISNTFDVCYLVGEDKDIFI